MGAGSIWVVIPAAGKGERFGIERPKQYLSIHQKTILEHTLEIFHTQSYIRQVVVSLSSSDPLFYSLDVASHPKIHAVIGASTRIGSVLNALHDISTKALPSDWVLIHDAVRPCLHHDDLTTLIRALAEDDVGGILAAPVSDTLKYVENHEITHTVDRAPLWQALTPQMFRLQLLIKALESCLHKGQAITDDAQGLEYLGLKPKVVMAKHPNPKLTYARDLQYISMILKEKELNLA